MARDPGRSTRNAAIASAIAEKAAPRLSSRRCAAARPADRRPGGVEDRTAPPPTMPPRTTVAPLLAPIAAIAATRGTTPEAAQTAWPPPGGR